MARANKLRLQERVPLRRTAWKFADLAILAVLLALLARRVASLLGNSGGAPPSRTWLVALVCEAWFTLVWLLNVNGKWSPVRFDTHPERLSERIDELPAVDMFVTTADPKLEPPAVTVNTVLSLLAVDYPADKLACYVSDDGCSPVTFYALREATEFAKLWVPFCKRHDVKVRAPFVYFSSSGSGPELGANDDEFLREWTSMKSEYEKLVSRIENAEEDSLVRRGGEFTEFLGAERRNHPTIIKVVWDNSTSKAEEGFPSLIYISREKRAQYHHHFKAGAMNVLTRASAVLTNAPIMLNVDCDMFANNPKVILHAMCLLLGFDDEVHSGFVQGPQKFYSALKDDPFGNQLEVLFQKLGSGIAGLQGIFYNGTGCFHRRKVIYGMPPDSISPRKIRGSPSYKELQKNLGTSKELIESARGIISGDILTAQAADIPSRIEAAKEVSACNYETGTCWGQETAFLNPNPPAFLGSAPTGGPASLTQYKRWETGLFEILLSKNNPILLSIFKHLGFRQCLAYLIIDVWSLRSVFELCYALLGPYCLLANQSFLPKASEPGFSIPLALFLTYNAYNFIEYMDCRVSARAWWNNQRMQRVYSSSAWLLAFLTVLLKTLGLSETVFEVTRKDKSTADGDDSAEDADPGRFTFDSSPVFIPPTALTIVNIVAVAVGAWRAVVVGAGEDVSGGPGVGEFVCCGWLLLLFWPFVRGLGGKGSYGIPWSVKLKAGLLVAALLASAMASAKKLPLQERVPVDRRAWKFADVVVLSLLVAALVHRSALILGSDGSPPWYWVAALACEAWFTLVWLLNMNVKWSPVRFNTHPERLAEMVDDELPAVDMFVTTADPKLEPPLVTVNTVLSLLAVDYPADKLACYVSDDGCSPVTCYAMREAAEFAKLWVPFCKRYDVKVRAPFVYFSSAPEPDDGFLHDWTAMKSEYEKLVSRIENAEESSLVRRDSEFSEFLGADRRNHPTIIKSTQGEGFPSLIYVSREKSPRYHHRFKAGAMNVLTRVSAVMTNAPIMLNMDCDMFTNNPKVIRHAMCLLLGFDDEVDSGFVQTPQKFYGALKDDPFGNQMEVLFKKLGFGVAGLQGMFYAGTGCFHRRKIIYSLPPDSIRDMEPSKIKCSPSYKELQTNLGRSKELIDSARSIISGDMFTAPTVDISSRINVAKEVSACSYEYGTRWGKEVGWVYGSVTEDILTGQRIHSAGWRSALLDTEPPAFLGSAPTEAPASLIQYKRWTTGLLEILFSKNNPILPSIFKHLEFRQCLAYLVVYIWPVRAPFELCYALLGPYCLLANQSFLPKASEPGFSIAISLFLMYNMHGFMEYMECGVSSRAWWNNHRMQRVYSSSAWILAFLTVILKTLGLSETVFEVTRKDQSGDASTEDADPGRFTFDASPVFIPPTALTILNMVAIAVGAWRAVTGAAEAGPGAGEFVCCGWVLLCLWPFVRGLVGKGSYGIPWSVKLKAGLLVAIFVHICRRI
ncbi:hypothetical protein EJB05_37974 [Eragrostis curvula]|uniref:Cellulose synthase-like protein H1 n=1 Tax=Eragrostis curvula TaxID=38414 RepID=A0A5J9TSX6_9POAL|nr:hypothetical protein EJB05_37974 [Eragrostis curvula]